MSGRVRPFSCGTQYIDWENSNCCKCAKYTVDAAGEEHIDCDLMLALSEANMDDGTISRETWERLGGHFWDRYVWPCLERVDEDGDGWADYESLRRLPMQFELSLEGVNA